MSIEYKIVNNEKIMHFEIHVEDEIAFLEYRFSKNNIAFMHTLVPEKLEGKGMASALAVFAFNFAKENNHPVLVYCPFVKTFLKRHPEYSSQLAN